MEKFQEISQVAIKKTMSYRWAVYIVVALAYFFVYFHRVSPSVMAPDLIKAFGVGTSALGLFSSMYFWAYAIGQLPAGIMADRLGARLTMAIFVGVAGVGAIVFGIAHSFGVALAGRFLVGFGVGFVYVPAMRLLADWFKSTEFATYAGILLAVGNVGALAAAAPLVVIMGSIGWRSSMNMVGIVSIIIAVLCFLIIRNKPTDVGGATPAQMEGREETKSSNAYSIGQAIAMTCKSWNVWTIIIIFFVWYGTIMAFQGLWAGPWLSNVYGMDKSQMSKYLTLIPIGMIVGCPLSGIVADKLFKSRFKTVLVGAIGSALVWIPLVFMTGKISLGALSVIMFLYGYFNGHFVILYANIKENVEPAIQGTATGFLNVFVFVGGALFQQITGSMIAKAPVVNKLIDVSGFKAAFLFCFIALLISLCVFFTQKKPQTN